MRRSRQSRLAVAALLLLVAALPTLAQEAGNAGQGEALEPGAEALPEIAATQDLAGAAQGEQAIFAGQREAERNAFLAKRQRAEEMPVGGGLVHLDATADAPGYTVFGQLVAGLDVAERIELADTGARNGMADVPLADVVVLSARRVQ